MKLRPPSEFRSPYCATPVSVNVRLGWSVEIWIPFQTLTFNPRLRSWHFNVQRRIQALLAAPPADLEGERLAQTARRLAQA